ncbi:MAG: lysophospholipid acyltransferase family protein, partial [Acidimicrobiales bacterium]
ARFDVEGVENIPAAGPVLLASNHRSYFDVVAIGLVAARLNRPVRFLAKQEIFEAPLVGRLARALGGIPVERGSGSSDSMRCAAAALRAGEVVIVLPQGTIPRGAAFFEPRLTGKTGTVRLSVQTGTPVIPIGLWGTEEVWPRSARVPDMTALGHPPTVSVRVGPPVEFRRGDAVADTESLMTAISELLPEELRVDRAPTSDELARTQPPA